MRIKILGLSLVLLSTLTLFGCENPLSKEKPEKVVADMFTKLSLLESMAFNSAISVSEDGSNKTTNVTIEGQTDFFRSDQPVADITLDLTSRSDRELKLKGQVRLVAQELYFKIKEFSDQEIMAKLGIKPNEWYAVGQELSEILASLGYSTSDKSIENQSGFSAEQKQKVRALISGANFAKVEETLPNEEVNGQECYHYRISFSEASAEKFLIGLEEIIGYSSGLDLVKEYFTPTANRTYEIWIGQDDHWLMRIAAQNVALDETIKVQTKSSFILEPKRFNEQFDITIPQKIEKLNLQEQLMFGNGRVDDRGVLKKDTDQDGLADFVESLYQTNPDNPDSDQDGFLDGEEVEHGYNPLGTGKLNPADFE